jgi:hypothetical protein
VPFVAGAVLVAGLLVFFLNRGGSSAARQVPVDPRAVAVARQFVHDAVERRNLERAYRNVTPELRRGYSLARWTTGNIPVVPYPGAHVAVAPFVPKLSLPRQVVFVVALRAPGAAPASFRIGLVKRSGRWLVSSWAPSGALAPPG